MHTSALDICLQNFQDGKVSCVEELCTQLANRILYIPTAAPIQDEDSSAKVNVIEHQEAHRFLIPIFTSEQKLKTWSVLNEHDGSYIRLLGADFCTVLKDKWLLVNEGLQGEVELQPVIVERISELMFEEVPTDNPSDVSYLGSYSLENTSSESEGIENPINYHGRVNERNFIKTVEKAVEKQGQAAQELNTIVKTVRAESGEIETPVRERKKTSENIIRDEEPLRERKITSENVKSDEELSRNRKHTQANIKSWDDEEPVRKRRKTAQEGANGAMQAWNMLKESPPLDESIPFDKISDKAAENQTKIMQTEVDPKDLGKISKKLQESTKEKSEEDEEKSIWGLFK